VSTLLGLQLASQRREVRIDGSVENVVPRLIDGVHGRTRFETRPILERFQSGVLQYGCRGIESSTGAWAVFEVIEGAIEPRLRQPKRTGDGDDARQLGEPTEREKLPE
jgi:hypothetical protein